MTFLPGYPRRDRDSEQMATARRAGFRRISVFFAFVAGSIASAYLARTRFLSSGADSTITTIFAGALALIVAGGTPNTPTRRNTCVLIGACWLAGAGGGWVADLLSIPVMTGFLAESLFTSPFLRRPACSASRWSRRNFARLAQISPRHWQNQPLSR